VEEDTWEKEENLGNTREVVEEYEKEYKRTARRIREEEDSAYNRSELLGRYTAKFLYGWDDRKFKKEYLEKLERSWRKWKGSKFFWRKNLKRESTVMNQLDPINVITPGYTEELDDEGRLRNNEYLHYEVTDKECDGMGEMCDPYEGL